MSIIEREVEVSRTSIRTSTVTVRVEIPDDIDVDSKEFNDLISAKALDQAGDVDFNEVGKEVSVEYVV